MRPTHIVEGNVLSSNWESTNLNVNLIPLYPSPNLTFIGTFRIMFDPISGHHDPAKSTNKIYHHRDPGFEAPHWSVPRNGCPLRRDVTFGEVTPWTRVQILGMRESHSPGS